MPLIALATILGSIGLIGAWELFARPKIMSWFKKSKKNELEDETILNILSQIPNDDTDLISKQAELGVIQKQLENADKELKADLQLELTAAQLKLVQEIIIKRQIKRQGDKFNQNNIPVAEPDQTSGDSTQTQRSDQSQKVR